MAEFARKEFPDSTPQEVASQDAAAGHRSMLGWFLEEGGRLGGAQVDLTHERPTMVATRDLAAGELVMRVPRRLLLSVDTAVHSSIGYQLKAARIDTDRAYLAAWMAQARRRPSYWQPMLEAAGDFSHLPEHFGRVDWELLRGSQVHRLARESRSRMLQTFRSIGDTTPRGQRLRLRDFAWGWQMAAQAFRTQIDGAAKSAMVPFGDLFVHSHDANCTCGSDRSEAFQVVTARDVKCGTPLTISYGELPNPILMARYGLSIEDNPHEAVALPVPVPKAHWVHAIAPELTGRRDVPEFRLTDDLRNPGFLGLLMLLRLLSLPGRESARRHLDGAAWFDCRPPLDLANELAAMRRLEALCDATLAAFSCDPAGDDMLLQTSQLGPRQRHAIVTRRGEKRLLERYAALARDATRLLEQDAQALFAAVQARAEADRGKGYFEYLRRGIADWHRLPADKPRGKVPAAAGEGMAILDAAERALFRWFDEMGGVMPCAALGVHDGVRGMVATRDIAAGEAVVSSPRHTMLTSNVARHSSLGIRLHEAGANAFADVSYIAAYLAETRCSGGHWARTLESLPRSFDELPERFSREDWKLLDGTDAQLQTRAFWHRVKEDFRQMRRILPPWRRFRFHDYMWASEVVRTRGFRLSIDGAISATLVPVCDMFNHAVEPNCGWNTDSMHGLTMFALREVRAGMPLTISYCESDNSHLLSKYGFCVDDDAKARVTLRFEIGTPHWLHDFAEGLTGRHREPHFEVSREAFSADARRMFSFLRLLSLSGPDEAIENSCIDRENLQDVPLLSRRNEHEALARLLAQCERRLAAFGCGWEIDDRLLAAGGLSTSQRNAAIVRRGQKRMLEDIRAVASETMRVLQSQADEMRSALQGLEAAAARSPWAKAYWQQLHEQIA